MKTEEKQELNSIKHVEPEGNRSGWAQRIAHFVTNKINSSPFDV
jgi:hypothetical protein